MPLVHGHSPHPLPELAEEAPLGEHAACVKGAGVELDGVVGVVGGVEVEGKEVSGGTVEKGGEGELVVVKRRWRVIHGEIMGN